MRARALLLLAALPALALLLALAVPDTHARAATGSRPHVSLPVIERQVMCVTCKVALDESQSEQANLERRYIQTLIDAGQDEAEIKSSLVAQYGPTVLALPSANGFDLTVYIVPVVVVLGLVALLALLLPSWRRRARGPALAAGGTAPLSDDDAARLEADLAHFD
jgi:cytochrome c-type biogenesis protein CcmH